MELLLLSNSTNHASTMFDHAAEDLIVALAAGDRVTFVPYALANWDDYAERVTCGPRGVGYRGGPGHRADRPTGPFWMLRSW